MAQLMKKWGLSREQCISVSRSDERLTRPPQQKSSEHITGPEKAMQIDLVSELTPSGGVENTLTAMNVFSGYIFDYPIWDQDAKTFAKIIINMLIKHACLPTTIASDKRSVFVSELLKEVAQNK